MGQRCVTFLLEVTSSLCMRVHCLQPPPPPQNSSFMFPWERHARHNNSLHLRHSFGSTLSLNLPNFLGLILFKVVDYLQKKFEELGSPNKMKVSMGHGAKAWVSDFNHPHYMAGRKAMKTGTVAEWCKANIFFFFLAV